MAKKENEQVEEVTNLPEKNNEVDYKAELEDLKSKYKEIVKKTKAQEELLQKMDLIVAKELDGVVEDKEKNIDTKSLFNSIMEKKNKEELEIKKELEMEKIRETEEENKRLKLELGITKIIEKEPYLKGYIEEGIENGKFDSLDDIEKNLTPSMKDALKFFYEANNIRKNGGGDPLKSYLQLADVEKKNEKELRRKKALEDWAKKLSR